MRIVIDLDGVVTELKKTNQDYADLRINPKAVERIRDLKSAGHYIILQTARHMKTCAGDQGQLLARIGKKTLDWLQRHNVPYDEIYFGKPYADVYIDDLAYKFTSWDDVNADDFDEESVNIIIPMAGAGSRFVKAGFDKPKPLIDVLGEPMVKWAVKSFDFLNQIKKYRLIFIILAEHDVKYHLSSELKNIFGDNSTVIALDKITRGQAETCLAAKKYINNQNKLFIYNCDTYSSSKIWDLIQSENPDGIIPCFKASSPNYSYAKLDEYGYVEETVEKKVISDLATSGMYYFRRGADFVAAAEKIIDANETQNNEFYVAPCYNEMLKSGKRIKTLLIDKNYVLGTPEELDIFLKTYKE